MPPMITSDDSGSEDLDTIPAKATKAARKSTKAASPEPDEDDEVDARSQANGKDSDAEEGGDDEDDDEDGETYAVEKILSHDYFKGSLVYRVKWLGYDDEKDMTWEPTENLTEGAPDVLEEYHKKIGGAPPAKPVKGGRGKRKAASSTPASPAPAASTSARGRPAKKAKANGEWQAPVGSWEDEVQSIQTICDDPDGSLAVFMIFNDGHRTKLSMDVARQKCPQKLLDYYEQHLTFKEPRVETEMDSGED